MLVIKPQNNILYIRYTNPRRKGNKYDKVVEIEPIKLSVVLVQ